MGGVVAAAILATNGRKSAEIGCRRADLDRSRAVAPPPPHRSQQIDHPRDANTLPDANAVPDLPGGAAAALNESSLCRRAKYCILYYFLLDKEILCCKFILCFHVSTYQYHWHTFRDGRPSVNHPNSNRLIFEPGRWHW